mgnify:CR=1 FL=1|jgi:hypothetical protein
MSTAVLQAVSKVFTSEVIDLFLREGLVDYYEVVSSFVKDETATDDELSRNERTMNALTIVIEDFMTPDEFKQWLKERT